jgi:hypothetical protein
VRFAAGGAESDVYFDGTLRGITETGEIIIMPRGEKQARIFAAGELKLI